MIKNFERHLIRDTSSIRDALVMLNKLASDAILFVVDEKEKLVGSLTDGDIRRGLIKDKALDSNVLDFIQKEPKFIQKGNYSLKKIIKLRDQNFRTLPVVDRDHKIVNVINLRLLKSYLPVDAVIMAGGRGERLRPLTNSTPKPLLMVDGKPIIDYNMERLRLFGIDDFWISVRYLGGQIEEHYGDGSKLGVNINYVWENEPLGTLGAVSKISNFKHDYILVTNSDLLTTLNYEDFFLDFIKNDADMAVGTIPYNVDVPYAVLETSNNHVVSFKEKPTYTYYSNGGIYLLKKDLLRKIPKNQYYNATDLMQNVIDSGGKLISFPIRQYWLDIGKPEDFEKAQKDVKHLNLQ